MILVVTAKRRAASACLALLWLGLAPQTVAAENAVPPLPATSLTSLLQMMLGLGLVLAAIAGTAWLLRRYAPGQVASAGAMRVVSGVMVGPKERVVLVDVGDTRLVLGVAPGQVSLLHQMPRPDDVVSETSPMASGPFYTNLRQILQRRGGTS
jgi:flagellar protein FliO/FliZ